MTLSTFAAALEDMSAQIERSMMRIEQGGLETDVHDLRLALTDVLGLIERNPGIEDLYATAVAVVRDAAEGPPDLRRLRLLREARLRYRERLAKARPTSRPSAIAVWCR